MEKINLGQLLWQITMATQDIERLDNEELFEVYKQAYAAHLYSLEDGVSEMERRWALKLFEDVEIETKRRHLSVIAAFVSMDRNGNFVCGREDLKEIFSKMSFDERLEVADDMRSHCETEAQRLALIELEREVLFMEN
jgi:hypothetical protein